MFHHNARSIISEGRLDEYSVIFDSLNDPFSVLGFSETWLKDENVSNIQIMGYEHIYNIRPSVDHNFRNIGGGLSLFVKHGLNFTTKDHLSIMESYMESLFIEINCKNTNFIIGLIYRVPNTNCKLFINKLNEMLESIGNKSEIILMGDFNIDLLKDNSHARDFFNMMLSHYLTPTILEATRVVSNIKNGQVQKSETLIDNIFISRKEDIDSGLIKTSVTDHYPVFLSLSLNSEPETSSTKLRTVKIRLIDKVRIKRFNTALNSKLSKILPSLENAKLAFSSYFEVFNSLYEYHFPIITKVLKAKSVLKPWVNDVLIERIKIRDKLSILFNKGKIEKSIFTSFRNRLNGQLRSAKFNYFQSEFLKFQNNGKKTWSIINDNIGNCNKSRDFCLKDNDKVISGNSVPNFFMDYFSSISKNVESGTNLHLTNIRSYLGCKNEYTYSSFMTPIVISEVETAISQLKNSNTLLSISSAVLENVKSIISPHLTNIFNMCINQGYFPVELKVGRITPVFKRGCKYLVNNYRPICNLSPFSKILERLVFNRMMEFIEKSNILSSTQYGFRKGMGTDVALINFIKFIHNNLSNELNVGAIFMDLTKAFDLMDLNILKIKLEHYGFRGVFLDFLMSFVENRKYFVYVNGTASLTKTINLGVPQGSTLGPLLFLLFINDMRNSSKHLFFNQFADDTTTMLSSPNINELNSQLESEGNKVLVWLKTNRLKINLEKTNCMLFTTKKNSPSLKIILDNKILSMVSETKFLGVIVDNKLSWKSHIKHISTKISKSLAILKIVKNIFPRNILRMIYMSLIYPHINYCNIIWGSATKTSLEPLFLLQKKAIRLISKSSYLAHTDPLFRSSYVMKVHQVFKFNCLVFMYKCLKMGKYCDFKNKLSKSSSFHEYNTRNHDLFRQPRERLNICKNSFYVSGILLWNDLDNDTKESVNIHVFKRKLKALYNNE